MAHDFRRKSSVLCYAYPLTGGEIRDAAIMGGADLGDRKTGRDFRAVSEKLTACFHKEDRHITLVFPPRLHKMTNPNNHDFVYFRTVTRLMLTMERTD